MTKSLEEDLEKRDLLKFFYNHTVEESLYLRERQYKIFTWTSSIFIAVIGVLLITDSNTKLPFNADDPVAKIVATCALMLFTGFSVNWQQLNRAYIYQNRQVINKTQELLHCFDKGYFDFESEEALFPNEWRFSASANRKTFFQRLGFANFVSATIFLGFLAIVMVWIYNP